MIICVILIAGSALVGINYFINQLILNYTPFVYSINSRKSKTSTNQGLQLAACSLRLKTLPLPFYHSHEGLF